MIRLLTLLLILVLPQIGQPQQPLSPEATENDDGQSTEEIGVMLESIAVQMEAIAGNLAAAIDAQEQNQQVQELARLDLQQQTSMAWGTIVMAIAAIIGLGISIYGIRLLIKNLKEARQAVAAANRSAKASEKVMRQDRAWVTIDARTVVAEDLPKGMGVGVVYTFRNGGRTPAINVNVSIDTKRPSNESIEIEESIFFSQCYQLHTIGVIGPGGVHTETIYFNIHEVDSLTNYTHRCFIHAYIEYQTMYEEIQGWTECTDELAWGAINTSVGFFLDLPDPERTDLGTYDDEFVTRPFGPQQRAE